MRSGRPTPPEKRVSPVRTNQGSGARVLSVTRIETLSGVCPGVWRIKSDTLPRSSRSPSPTSIAGATVYSTMEPCPMCAGAMKLAGIARLVLGTRHDTLRRTDLGTYSIETFCRMAGYDLALTTGVRERECTALRRRWGRDSIRAS